ncbi:MAG: Hsp20/alpha crystallin family protein [Sulfolobaceae archaeon]|nr:Hsp20/alpha crystallin family protein [Sulfolobaceae archaeon]
MALAIDVITREVSKRLEELTRGFYEVISPPIDMYEEGGELVIVADMPGFDKDKINVRIMADNTLAISAEREIKTTQPVYLAQRPKKIEKRIRLPVKVPKDAEIIGKYENGILTLRIPIEGRVKVKIE